MTRTCSSAVTPHDDSVGGDFPETFVPSFGREHV